MAEERALDSHSKLCHKVFRKSFDTWSYIKPKSEGFKKQFIDIFEENSPLILFSTRGKKEEKNFKNERKKKVNWKTNERRRKVDERERGGSGDRRDGGRAKWIEEEYFFCSNRKSSRWNEDVKKLFSLSGNKKIRIYNFCLPPRLT